jgi:hypothetical protein
VGGGDFVDSGGSKGGVGFDDGGGSRHGVATARS